jgi:dihydrofolate reductase
MPHGTIDRDWTGLVLIAASLDGYIARHDGDIEWLTDAPPESGHVDGHRGPHPPPDYSEFYDSVDHLVIGRGTYEKVRTFDAWPYAGKDVIVLSSTLVDGDDPQVRVAPDLDAAVELLDRDDARRVYVDGGRTITAFLRRGLIDELTVSTAPVLLGSGLPLFGALEEDVRLIHLGTSTGDTGMVTSHYRVATPGRRAR